MLLLVRILFVCRVPNDCYCSLVKKEVDLRGLHGTQHLINTPKAALLEAWGAIDAENEVLNCQCSNYLMPNT